MQRYLVAAILLCFSASVSALAADQQAELSDISLFERLESSDPKLRDAAEKELIRRGDKNRNALLKIVGDEEKSVEARQSALAALKSMWSDKVQKSCFDLLLDGNANLRIDAAETLGLRTKKGDKKVHEVLIRHLNDESPKVRRAIYLAIGRINAPGSADVLANRVLFEKSEDPAVKEVLVRAIEQTGKAGVDSLRLISDSGDREKLHKVVGVFLMMKTRVAAEALLPLIRNYHLTPEQKAKLVRSYRNYNLDPPVSLEPLVDYVYNLSLPSIKQLSKLQEDKLAAVTGDVAIKVAALDILGDKRSLSNPKVKLMILQTLAGDYPELRIAAAEAISKGRLNEASPHLQGQLARMLVLGNDEVKRRLNAASLSAQNLDVYADARAMVQTLAVLKDKTSVPLLSSVLDTGHLLKTAAGRKLLAQTLRALDSLDEKRAERSASDFLEVPNVQKEAVVIIGKSPRGAKDVAERFVEGKLPARLRPQVVEALKRHADQHREHADLLKIVIERNE